MEKPLFWQEPELTFLRRFFDGVDRAVTDEMQAGRTLMEENLTFLLCRLLDGASTFQRMLAYSLEELNADLDRGGTGQRVAIEFETNEHKKSFEGAVSHADLGIVLRREPSPLAPSLTKALIVQAKRLYPSHGDYRIGSGYDAFDGGQFNALKELAGKYDRNGVVYFLYNPKLDAFLEVDQSLLKPLEVECDGSSQAPWPFRREMYYFLREFGTSLPMWGRPHAAENASSDELLARRERALEGRPGVRVLGISSVGQIVESMRRIRGSFSLGDCYEYARSHHWWQSNGSVPFLPLASFLVDMFMGCFRGSSNENMIRIAEGKVPEPGPDEGEPPGLAVRHTLRIRISNTFSQDIERLH